jgi:hypothetical protein
MTIARHRREQKEGRRRSAIASLLAFEIPTATMFAQQTTGAKQDAKKAGKEAKQAGREAGEATKDAKATAKGTRHAAKATAKGTKKVARTVNASGLRTPPARCARTARPRPARRKPPHATTMAA